MAVDFIHLPKSDLQIDEQFRGGTSGHVGDDPISKLMGVGNQGGFRLMGTGRARLAVLVTNSSDPDWPDGLDPETGIFTYFGDNKAPGRDLHGTPRRGNSFLRELFTAYEKPASIRKLMPPVFLFESTGVGRDVRFLGLGVPGVNGSTTESSLVAIWRTKDNQRFLNYRARFTVLNEERIDRRWLVELQTGVEFEEQQYMPELWERWIEHSIRIPLEAPKTVRYRSKNAQLPNEPRQKALIHTIYHHFREDPYAFEEFAAWIAKLHLGTVVSYDVTRRHRDGGRDALAKFRIGHGDGALFIDCAIEAKCYELSNGIGVRAVSRLISRLRHRQFGVLVTTSYVSSQAYEEIVEDGHPVVIVAARDMAQTLIQAGYSRSEQLLELLNNGFLTLESSASRRSR